jgi:hypothetical protein
LGPPRQDGHQKCADDAGSQATPNPQQGNWPERNQAGSLHPAELDFSAHGFQDNEREDTKGDDIANDSNDFDRKAVIEHANTSKHKHNDHL